MKLKTFSYNDFEAIVEHSKNQIKQFIKEKNIEFDYILSASKEDHIFNSMISIHFDIESIYLNKEGEDLKYKNILEVIKINNTNKSNNKLNILVTQSIYNDSEYMELSQILNNVNLVFITAFAPVGTIQDNLVILNTLKNVEIKLPWDKSQFIPLNQLEKLQDSERVTINKKNRNFVGFSSSDFMKEVYISLPEWKDFESISFQENKEFNEVKKMNVFYNLNSLREYELLNKEIINQKIDFIEVNGITEYVEENLLQAIILSSKIKVTKILFFEDKQLYSFNANYIADL